MNYLPYPNVGEDPLWDLCVKQSDEVISLQDFSYETKFSDCGEGRLQDFIDYWGFEPCGGLEELFVHFWRYYQDINNY